MKLIRVEQRRKREEKKPQQDEAKNRKSEIVIKSRKHLAG